MKPLLRCLLLLGASLAQHAFAAGIARIADGDCATLAAAMATPPAQEQALIVLARNGTYNCGALSVSANIAVDGAGSTLVFFQNSSPSSSSAPAISVAAGGSLLLRNTVVGNPAFNATSRGTSVRSGPPGPKFCCAFTSAVIVNAGTLNLDSVTIAGTSLVSGIFSPVFGFFSNSGSLSLRNVSLVGNDYAGQAPALLDNSGTVEIYNSTIVTTAASFAQALLDSSGSGVIRIGNSVVSNKGLSAAPICAAGSNAIVSLGGNVLSDSSCALNGANDRVAADVRTLDLARHGGVVPTLALNYDSPAIGNGLPANCEAADARGMSRNAGSCDAGAYEVGGGIGNLGATGMSGLYFNPENNGHYVSVQRLYGNQTLIIWNTFDKNGVPAWLYGVGTQIGGIERFVVDPVAQNVGGTLQPGGNVIGAKATPWGAFELTLDDCYHATLRYSSPLPSFGMGSTTLQRLAFLDGVNCER